MNKARVAEAALGSPPFYSIFNLECTKGLEVGGERWEELYRFSHPTSNLQKNDVDSAPMGRDLDPTDISEFVDKSEHKILIKRSLSG